MIGLQITAEKQHEIRYYVQQNFIPEMVQSVKDGYLPLIAIFPSPVWYYNLRIEYELDELKAAKVWDDFERIEVDEDRLIVLYTFPQPVEIPEALYGAVLLNQFTNDVKYFTLESGNADKWVVCGRDTSMHSCLEIWDSADKENFLEWAKTAF